MAIVRDAEPRVCLPTCEVAWKLALFWDVLLVAVHCAFVELKIFFEPPGTSAPVVASITVHAGQTTLTDALVAAGMSAA